MPAAKTRKLMGHELKLIRAIAERTAAVVATHGREVDPTTFVMDLLATHGESCRLDLDRLYAADDFNLLHDVLGINRHLDRETYELRDCFWPRFALPAAQQPSAV